jgi:hypothetical protein
VRPAGFEPATRCLEGFECGGAEQYVRRSDHVATCPSVTVNLFGLPSDWARNGHAYGATRRRREWLLLSWLLAFGLDVLSKVSRS